MAGCSANSIMKESFDDDSPNVSGFNTGARRLIDVTDHKVTPTQQIISSCFGAVATSLVVTPLDVVKVRLQKQLNLFGPTKTSAAVSERNLRPQPGLMDHLYTCTRAAAAQTTHVGSAECPWYARPGQFTGTFNALHTIARQEGFTSLYSGLSPTLIMAIPATVGYYFLYDNARFVLRQRWGDTLWAPVVAGASTRVLMVTAVAPFEIVRTKLQSEQLSLRDMRRVVRRSVAQGGWLSLWRGWVPTVLRDVPFSALYWAFYELLKSRVLLAAERDQTNFGISFACGAIAGSLAAAFTLPFDVVKTQRQIALGEKRLANGEASKTLEMLAQIYRTNGMAGLFTGFIPRVGRVAPSCAIMIGSYEYGKIFFAQRNEQQ